MSLTINPESGSNSSIVFLENDSSQPIAIQMSVNKRLMDRSGKEEMPEELEQLQIFPNQLIIPPFEKKSVKVTWIGKSGKENSNEKNIEKAFRIIAEQLPIDLEKEKKRKRGNVKILLRYVGALYVDLGKTQSEVQLKKFTTTKKELNFIIENKGSKHQVLSNLKLVFIKKGNPDIQIDSKDLKNFAGENILAQSERDFILLKDKKLESIDESYQVKLNFDQD
jgi:fimbrial chaperone protein